MEAGETPAPPSAFCCRRPPDLEALKRKYADWLKPCRKSADQVLAFLKKRFSLEAKTSPYEKILHHALLQPDPDRDGYPQKSLNLESYRVIRDAGSEVFYRNRRDSEDIYVTFCRVADLLDGNDIQCLIDVERGITREEIAAGELLPFLEGLEMLHEIGEDAYLAGRKREIAAVQGETPPPAGARPAVPLCVNHILIFRAASGGQALVGLFASAGDGSKGDTLTKISYAGLEVSCPGFEKKIAPAEAELAEAEPGEFQEHDFGVLTGIPTPSLCTVTARGLRFYSKNRAGWLDSDFQEEVKIEKGLWDAK